MMGWLRERVKAIMDRRYVTQAEVADLVSEALTRAEVADLVREATRELHRPVAFLADLDPHELRKKLFEAHRLAMESAKAIELILQTEVLMWREIDRVAQASGVPLDTSDRLL